MKGCRVREGVNRLYEEGVVRAYQWRRSMDLDSLFIVA